MTTFMANAQNVTRKWYIVDAEGIPLGRIATKVASILRGKHKPTFTPLVDTGDHVIIINCDKLVLTGKKLDQKMYRHHSGYTGGLKEVPYRKMIETKSDKVMYMAVKGMLPKNKLGSAMLLKLRVYKGSEHTQQAQNPQVLEI